LIRQRCSCKGARSIGSFNCRKERSRPVAVDVTTIVAGVLVSSVKVASDDRGSRAQSGIGVVVLQDGFDLWISGLTGVDLVDVVSLIASPSKVASLDDEVYLLVHVLSDITTDVIGGSSLVKGTSPRVSKSIGPDLWATCIGEWVVLGNVVGKIRVLAVDVDSKHLSVPSIQILSVGIGIVSGTSVTKGNIEVSIGTKVETTSLVICKGLIDSQENSF